MSLVDDTPQNRAALVSQGAPGDFIQLLKPRVMSLVVFTALVGMVVAPGSIHPVLAAASLLAIAVGAGASGALNMWYDADVDALMHRTVGRPIPAGRVAPGEALAFGLILSVLSVMVLGIVANWLAAGLLAFTIFFYAVVYTMWLKRWTPQNIVIGGAAGAFPPVIGWAAVTGSISIEPLILFLIIFAWTPPHFWALAILKTDDYARAGIPMMPVVAGADETRRQIFIYTLILAPIGIAPWLMGFAGRLYAGASILGGLMMLACAIDILRHREGPAARKSAGRMFAFSIVYLFVLFAVLLVERAVLSRFM